MQGGQRPKVGARLHDAEFPPRALSLLAFNKNLPDGSTVRTYHRATEAGLLVWARANR